LRELIAKYQAIDPYLIAEIYAFRNQSDEAFEWLDRAYAQRNGGLTFTKVEPLLTKEVAQRPAICRALEEAQSADLTNRGAALNEKDPRSMNTQSRVLWAYRPSARSETTRHCTRRRLRSQAPGPL
jgi:hypothetical protein